MDITPLRQILLTFMVATPRFLTAFAVLPFLGKDVLPGMVRNSVVLVFVLILYPMVSPGVADGLPAFPLLFVLLAKEVVLGVLIGFLAGVVFWAAECVGCFIDNQRGAGVASLFDPLAGSQTSVLGSFLVQLLTVLFFTGGGFLLFLGVLFESYRLWPVFSPFPRFSLGFSDLFLGQADRMMRLTVVLGGPVVIAMFIGEFGLGLMNRFAPQLNVFFLSMPIKSGIAFFMLVLYLRFLEACFREEWMTFENLTKVLVAGCVGPPS